jgi:hypothetical protein
LDRTTEKTSKPHRWTLVNDITSDVATCLHCCYYWNYWVSQQEPSQYQPTQPDGAVWKAELTGLDVDLSRTQHITDFKLGSIQS